MAQANVVYISKRDVAHGESFRDLEGDICELALMAKLASREIEGVLDDVAAGTDQYERGTFAITHLCEMIERLKASYYEQFAAGR